MITTRRQSDHAVMRKEERKGEYGRVRERERGGSEMEQSSQADIVIVLTSCGRFPQPMPSQDYSVEREFSQSGIASD
jgi:hypothetical protein